MDRLLALPGGTYSAHSMVALEVSLIEGLIRAIRDFSTVTLG